MRQMLMFVVLTAFAAVSSFAITDQELETELSALRKCRSPAARDRQVLRALSDADFDTNRLCRVLVSAAERNTNFVYAASYYVGVYGSSNDVPALCRLLGGTHSSKAAVMSSVIALGGIDSGALNIMTNLFMTSANQEDGCHNLAMWRKALRAARNKSDAATLSQVVSGAICYASQERYYISEIDHAIGAAMPSYIESKRRLCALRNVRALCVTPCQTNYVATAIAELEAYPEADLPE